MVITDTRTQRGETSGAFVRGEYPIQGRFSGGRVVGFQAEPGRYHLYVSLACPWAHRAIIVRRLLGLEDAISMSVVDPDPRRARLGVPRAGYRRSRQRLPVPLRGLPAPPTRRSTGRYTVPCIWDRQTRPARHQQLPRHHASTSRRSSPPSTGPVRRISIPQPLRAEIDAINARSSIDDVNNGVYKAGFATTQAAYEDGGRRALRPARLAGGRGSRGSATSSAMQLTEADIRLFTTLVRFDAVYHGHFKCNLRRLIDYPESVGLRARPVPAPRLRRDGELRSHQAPLLHDAHHINPTRIVPKGPEMDWSAPAGCDALDSCRLVSDADLRDVLATGGQRCYRAGEREGTMTHLYLMQTMALLGLRIRYWIIIIIVIVIIAGYREYTRRNA